uniref:Uncharacterized protein n=1 Tax=Anguilla anguilla TaxID=7936 RepID=A0A0E9RGC1_ANGAN
MLWGFLFSVRTVTPDARYLSPFLSAKTQNPLFGLHGMFPFLLMDSFTTPTFHSHLFPTFTSQLCFPEVNPSDPSTFTQGLNRSGLSGYFWSVPVCLTVVRSSERER